MSQERESLDFMYVILSNFKLENKGLGYDNFTSVEFQKHIKAQSANEFMYFDSDAMFLKRDHRLKIEDAIDDTLYITVMRNSSVETQELQYQVQITLKEENFCFQECEGSCHNNNLCLCNEKDTFGKFCENKYQLMDLNEQFQDVFLFEGQWNFVSTYIKYNRDDFYKIHIEKQNQQNDLEVQRYNLGIGFYFPDNSTFTQPNFLQYYYEIQENQERNKYTISPVFIKNMIKEGQKSTQVIIGFFIQDTGGNSQQIKIKMEIVKEEQEKGENSIPNWVLYIFTGLAIIGVVFMIAVIVTIIKGSFQYERGRRRQRVQPVEEKLTKESIDKYLPKVQYGVCEDKQVKIVEECPICLVEFEAQDYIRQTLCNHVFHENCIDEWLLKHKNCPLCRQEHTLKKIKRSKTPQDDQQQQQDETTNNNLVIQTNQNNQNTDASETEGSDSDEEQDTEQENVQAEQDDDDDNQSEEEDSHEQSNYYQVNQSNNSSLQVSQRNNQHNNSNVIEHDANQSNNIQHQQQLQNSIQQNITQSQSQIISDMINNQRNSQIQNDQVNIQIKDQKEKELQIQEEKIQEQQEPKNIEIDINSSEENIQQIDQLQQTGRENTENVGHNDETLSKDNNIRQLESSYQSKNSLQQQQQQEKQQQSGQNIEIQDQIDGNNNNISISMNKRNKNNTSRQKFNLSGQGSQVQFNLNTSNNSNGEQEEEEEEEQKLNN